MILTVKLIWCCPDVHTHVFRYYRRMYVLLSQVHSIFFYSTFHVSAYLSYVWAATATIDCIHPPPPLSVVMVSGPYLKEVGGDWINGLYLTPIFFLYKIPIIPSVTPDRYIFSARHNSVFITNLFQMISLYKNSINIYIKMELANFSTEISNTYILSTHTIWILISINNHIPMITQSHGATFCFCCNSRKAAVP